MLILGIDVGGTGIKSGVVETQTGALTGQKTRIATPAGAEPDDIAEILEGLVSLHGWEGPVGIGLPSVIRDNTVCTAANLDASFIGLPVGDLFSDATANPVFAVNDADAAGLAEMRFGAGQDQAGVVLVVTIGTGIGTSLFVDGKLLPNTELGHLLLDNGREAERYASASARVRQKLGWKAWSKRLNHYLMTMEKLFWPDLMIVGGGISKRFEKFAPMLTTRAPVVSARYLNKAGIIGAALHAEHCLAVFDKSVPENIPLPSVTIPNFP